MIRRKILFTALSLGVSAFAVGALPLASPAMADVGEIRDLTLLARDQGANPQAFQAAQLIAQVWNQLGLKVTVRGMPRLQQSELVWYNRDKWDMTMWQMVGRPERSDPDELLFNLFHSSTTESGYNFIGYKSEEFDKLAEAQRVETDKDKRSDLIKQAQAVLARDQPNMFLVYPKRTFAFDNAIFADDSVVEQSGLGIKNIWSYLGAKPLGDQKDMILNSTDPLNAINPLYISGATDSWVTELIWDRLLRISPEGLAEPWAAESFEWLDQTTIDVVLREGMKWHDGMPVTVEDVVFSFEVPNVGDEVPMYKPFVKNIESIEIIDDRTVRFKLNNPSAAFLTSSLAKVNLVPKHIWQPVIDDLANRPENAESYQEDLPIGSGPFKFVRWKQQEEVVLARNPEHFSPPQIDRWIIRIVSNSEATISMLRSGEINFLADYNGDPEILKDVAAKDGDISIVSSTDIGFQYATVNQRRPPFDDVAMRRALSLAIDRDLMVEAAWNGSAEVANSPVSTALAFWRDDDALAISANLEEAKALLKDAGYRLIDGRLHYPEGVEETLVGP